MNFSDSHEWVMWQAARAVGEPIIHQGMTQVEPKPVVVQKTKRKPHWGGSFQIGFAQWLKGASERPCDLGYTRRELMRHLQRQFSKGMTWENYAANKPFNSQKVWVVDHIVPKSLYDQEDLLHAYALSNLRPLWILENLAKGKARGHLV